MPLILISVGKKVRQRPAWRRLNEVEESPGEFKALIGPKEGNQDASFLICCRRCERGQELLVVVQLLLGSLVLTGKGA
jgi:hypothetical protein